MTDLIRLLLDLAAYLLPFKVVFQWQRGLYYFVGRYQWTTGPGLKIVCPGITEVKTLSVVPEIHTTPLQSITLRDGRTLTYSASITAEVVDPFLAYNKVGHYEETVVELAARLVSSELALADPKRLEDPSHGKRDNLLEEIRKELDTESRKYGVSITALGLNNFVLGVRTIRLLMDRAVIAEKSTGIS